MTRSRKSTSGRILSIDGALCDIPFVAWWDYDPSSPFEVVADLHHRKVRLHRDHLVEGVDDEHRAGDVTIKPDRDGTVWLRITDDLGGVLYLFIRSEMLSVARMVQELSPSPDDVSRSWDEALRREVLSS